MEASLDATFAALSDATRRDILVRLQQGETSVGALAAPYKMSLPAVAKHLAVLEEAGLVARRKEGRVHHVRLLAEPMQAASNWITQYRRFWENQFDALAQYLEETQKPENVPWQARTSKSDSRLKSAASSTRRAKKSTRPGRNANS
jgi:DNA-binding transcriptional ArsR family regulator